MKVQFEITRQDMYEGRRLTMPLRHGFRTMRRMRREGFDVTHVRLVRS